LRRAYAVAVALLAVFAGAARPFDVVLNAQGEFLDAYLIDGTEPPRRVVFVDPDPAEPESIRGRPPRVGRHVNGKLCFFPRGCGHDGGFVIADDTYREACLDRDPPQARCAVKRRGSPWYVGKDPDGWGVFKANGKWTKRQIHTPWDFSEPKPQGNIDPQGCAFDAQGRLFATDVGSGNFGDDDGSLLVFFPGKRNRYDAYCFIDKHLAAPGMPVMDDAGNLYIPEPAGTRLTKFSPPFPSTVADCDNADHLVTTPPTKAVVPTPGLVTPAGIARVPGSSRVYLGSVVIPARIDEYDLAGGFVRTIVPDGVPKNPLGIDVGTDGTAYYAELNLDPQTSSPRCGQVSRVRLANGVPLAPEVLATRLRFPDGVTVVDSSRLKVRLSKLPAAVSVDPSRCGGE
jgi:hypothetical protein